VDGIVKESLPNAKFRVELVATKAIIVCSTSGKMRKNFVRVLVGDPVKVSVSGLLHSNPSPTVFHTEELTTPYSICALAGGAVPLRPYPRPYHVQVQDR
jgi:translation initiation factor IF-1